MTEWRVCTLAELEERGRSTVEVDGRSVGVFLLDDGLRAYTDICPHQGGPVCQGKVMPRVVALLGPDREVVTEAYADDAFHIVCPWHGWEFDIDSGRCVGDSRYGLQPYRVFERDGQVYVAD